MSKKIISPIGSLLLGKKKKKAEPEAAPVAAPTKGPKVTPLGAAGLPLTKRKASVGTIFGLSEKLGG